MGNRNLLHVSKVEDFKAYLDEIGVEHRPGRGEYELLQVHVDGAWPKLYSRLKMPEHVTVQNALIPLVTAFIHRSKLPEPINEVDPEVFLDSDGPPW